jgi:hypothetical protein
MKRASVLLLVVGVACSKNQGPPLSPLPPDQPQEPMVKKDDDGDKKPVEPPVRPAPTGPLDAKITYPTPTVKLVKPGTGKRAKLVVVAKPGAKQAVEIALDFGVIRSIGDDSDTDIAPTIVLGGDATVTGAAGEWAIAVTKLAALDTPNVKVPIDKFREVLQNTKGVAISGKVAANGQTGEVALHVDNQAELGAQILDLVRLTLPAWPVVPAEPIGQGAKWTVTASTKFADLDVAITTEYEVVSLKGTEWTIKGTTKLTGPEQMAQGGKISKLTGAGSVELVWNQGTLFPSKHVTKIETTFVATEAEPKGAVAATLDFKIRAGAAITAK